LNIDEPQYRHPGNYASVVEKDVKIILKHMGCVRPLGICFLFDISKKSISEETAMAHISIIDNQVYLRLEEQSNFIAKGEYFDGCTPIDSPIVLPENICKEFGYTEVTILPGLYMNDFNNYSKFGELYLDAVIFFIIKII